MATTSARARRPFSGVRRFSGLASVKRSCDRADFHITGAKTPKEIQMPNMSDSRRKKIQARQRKAENAKKREAKIVKKERNKEQA